MATVCSLRILTGRMGGGMLDGYHTIPLYDKTSYKVANESGSKVNRSFSIQAYAFEPWEDKLTGTGVTQQQLLDALQQDGHIKITSSTGTVYVNAGPAKDKGGYDPTHGIGGGTAMVVKSVLSFANSLYSSATASALYNFSITARETPTTRFQYKGELELGMLYHKVAKGGLLDGPAGGSLAKQVSGLDDMKGNAVTTYGAIGSVFKYFRG